MALNVLPDDSSTAALASNVSEANRAYLKTTARVEAREKAQQETTDGLPKRHCANNSPPSAERGDIISHPCEEKSISRANYCAIIRGELLATSHSGTLPHFSYTVRQTPTGLLRKVPTKGNDIGTDIDNTTGI